MADLLPISERLYDLSILLVFRFDDTYEHDVLLNHHIPVEEASQQRCQADLVDLARNTLGVVMNDFDGRICEQGVGCPSNMQVMCDVALGFLQGHPRKMEPQVQPLHNRLVDLRAENPPKFWLPQENQAHRRK